MYDHDYFSAYDCCACKYPPSGELDDSVEDDADYSTEDDDTADEAAAEEAPAEEYVEESLSGKVLI